MNLILAILLLAGGSPRHETIDLASFLRPVPQGEAELLGSPRLQSGGGFGFGFGFWEEEAPDALPILDLLAGVEAATGLVSSDWDVLGERYLRLPAPEAAAVREALSSLAADLFRSVRIDVEVVEPGGRVTRGTLFARDGIATSFHATAGRRFHTDNDVEIACSNSEWGAPSVIVDPIVQTAFEGVSVEVRPMILDDEGAVALEAVVMAGRFDRFAAELDLRGRRHGRLQLPTYRGVYGTVSGRAGPKRPLVAEIATPDGITTVRLVAEVRGDPGTGDLRWLPDTLVRLPNAPLDPVREEPSEGIWQTFREVHALPLPLTGGSFSPFQTDAIPDGPRALRRRLAERTREAAELGRTVHLEVRRLADGDERARFSIPALTGRVVVARAGRDVSYVRDWDVEVGCYNQIGDPIVGPAFSGDHARLCPRLSPDGRTVAIDVVYEFRDTRLLPPPGSGMEVTGAIHPVRAGLRAFRGEITLPVGEERRIRLGGGQILSIRCRANVDAGDERR